MATSLIDLYPGETEKLEVIGKQETINRAPTIQEAIRHIFQAEVKDYHDPRGLPQVELVNIRPLLGDIPPWLFEPVISSKNPLAQTIESKVTHIKQMDARAQLLL